MADAARSRVARRSRILTLADGDREVNPWCAQPWDEHIYAYLDAGACIIRHEDLLGTPERECRRLLEHAWSTELSDAQQQFCRERFGNMLTRLDYKLADTAAE